MVNCRLNLIRDRAFGTVTSANLPPDFLDDFLGITQGLFARYRGF